MVSASSTSWSPHRRDGVTVIVVEQFVSTLCGWPTCAILLTRFTSREPDEMAEAASALPQLRG